MKIPDCRPFSILKTVTGYRSYSQFFCPVKAIVRTDEANSMAFLQREFLLPNDTYKTKTSAGNTLYVATKTSRIPRKAKHFFWGEIFCLEYPSTRSEKGNVHFANYRFSFRKLQIFPRLGTHDPRLRTNDPRLGAHDPRPTDTPWPNVHERYLWLPLNGHE